MGKDLNVVTYMDLSRSRRKICIFAAIFFTFLAHYNMEMIQNTLKTIINWLSCQVDPLETRFSYQFVICLKPNKFYFFRTWLDIWFINRFKNRFFLKERKKEREMTTMCNLMKNKLYTWHDQLVHRNRILPIRQRRDASAVCDIILLFILKIYHSNVINRFIMTEFRDDVCMLCNLL